MGVLDAAARQLGHVGQAFLDLADRPGTFKLPRDLGSTPSQIVVNASTAKLPMQLFMPHEVAAKNEYLGQHAFDAAKRHVDKMAAKGTPMTPSDYADRLDQAQAWNYAQHKNLQLFGNDENYLLTTPHGWAAIATPDLQDPSRTAIEALNLNSAGAPGGGGANAYQALLALTKQQGLTNFTKELTPENTVRKPMNLMSHIMRTGDTSHLELDPSFWGHAGLWDPETGAPIHTPTAEEFSQLSVPAQLGYLANVGKENADYAMTKARYPHGLDTFMRDSAISPSLVGRDYSAVNPQALQDLLGRTGPDSGVGDTALRQAMLTHALNGQFDLMGSATPPMNVNRIAPDFTQGLAYAEGGVVDNSPTPDGGADPLTALQQTLGGLNLADRPLDNGEPDTSFRDSTVAGPVPLGVLRSLWSHAVHGGFRGPSAMDAYVAKQLGVPVDRLNTKFFGSNRVVYPVDSTTVAKLATTPHGLQVQGGDSLVLRPRLTPLDSWKGVEKPPSAKPRQSKENPTLGNEAAIAKNWGVDADGNLQIVDEGAVPGAPPYFSPRIAGVDWGVLKPVVSPDYWPGEPFTASGLDFAPYTFSRKPTSLAEDLSQVPGVVYDRDVHNDWAGSKLSDDEKTFVDQFSKEMQQRSNYAEGGVVNSHEGMTHDQPAVSSTEASLGGLGQWLQHLGHRAAHPFAPDVMAETAKNLKDQFGVGQPPGTTGEQDVSNALNFINPVGGELHGLMGALAVKPKGGNWFPMQLNDYIGNGVELGGNTHPAVKTWAETQLPRYLKTYLGTAEDPLLQVEKEGNLHIPELNQPGGDYEDRIGGALGGPDFMSARAKPGSPHHNLTGRITRTPWEQLADAQVRSEPLSESLEQARDFAGVDDLRTDPYSKQFHWAETADPTTQVWDTGFFPGDDPLQFNHVKDYLQHAVTTHATDPANPLALNPDSLSKLSVADAVRKTAAWDRANAAQVQSEKLAPLFQKPGKTYDSGWRWNTLQGPEDVDLASQVGQGNGWCFGSKSTAEHYLGKGSKLHVLTNPEGKPQVTVEESVPKVPSNPLVQDKMIVNTAPTLAQIKGRFNGAPDPEALPYVQDFVKRGLDDSMTAGEGWGNVSDLENTGLVQHEPVRLLGGETYTPPQGYSTPDEFRTHVQQNFTDAPSESVTSYLEGRFGPTDQNYAQGGLVHTTDPLHAILHAYYADAIGA